MISNNLKNNLILVISLFLYFIFVLPVFCNDDITKNESAYQAIAKGDLLHIEVMGHKDLTRDVTVDNKGKITFPFIEEIDAEGKMPAALAAVIEERLREFIKYPTVTVRYDNAFFVYGEVNRPGEYELHGHINILKAIIKAGGFTDFASHKVKIIKSKSKRKDIWVDVDGMISGKRKDKNILVEPGDIIVVPESFF